MIDHFVILFVDGPVGLRFFLFLLKGLYFIKGFFVCLALPSVSLCVVIPRS